MRPIPPSTLIRRLCLSTAASALALLVMGQAPAAQAQQAGVVSAARDAKLAAGAPVQVGQRLVTGPQGGLHVLLLDQSAILLGANSELTLDRFSHDGTGGGIAMTLHSGTARVVGGKNSKTQPTLITTRQGQVAISGGIAEVAAAAQASQATMLFGQQMRVTTANGATQDINRPGFGTTMLSDEAARQQAQAIVNSGSALSALQNLSSSSQTSFDHFNRILAGNITPTPDFLSNVGNTAASPLLGTLSIGSLQSSEAQRLNSVAPQAISATAPINGQSASSVVAMDRLSLSDNNGTVTPINATISIASPLNSLVPPSVVVPVTITAPPVEEPM